MLVVAALATGCLRAGRLPDWQGRGGLDYWRVARDVTGLAGSFALSPAGGQVAYITRGGVHVVEVETGARAALPASQWATHLAWSPRGGALALAGPGERLAVVEVAEGAPAVRVAAASERTPDGLFWRGDELLLTSFALTPYSFGLKVERFVQHLPAGAGEWVVDVSEEQMLLPGVVPPGGTPQATPFGLTPARAADGRLLLGVRRVPPAVPPYSALFIAERDGAELVSRPLVKRRTPYRGGAWSPDGRRVVAALDQGLVLIDMAGAVKPLRLLPEAATPAWSPAGSQIFANGLLLDSDGRNEQPLFPSDAATVATWSADGRALAVVHRGELWLVRGITPRYVAPDGPPAAVAGDARLPTLKRLRDAGLIDEETYRQRHGRLEPDAQ